MVIYKYTLYKFEMVIYKYTFWREVKIETTSMSHLLFQCRLHSRHSSLLSRERQLLYHECELLLVVLQSPQRVWVPHSRPQPLLSISKSLEVVSTHILWLEE